MAKRYWLVTAAAIAMLTTSAAAQYGEGWTIPADAAERKSPLKESADTPKKGKSLFESKCARCHGAEGKGNGPYSDPKHPAADLTDPARADVNPEGVMYFRVWNGKPPAMPAFKSQLTSDEVWTVVAYAHSLRKSS